VWIGLGLTAVGGVLVLTRRRLTRP
jgi:cytochrome c biogenesis factor